MGDARTAHRDAKTFNDVVAERLSRVTF